MIIYPNLAKFPGALGQLFFLFFLQVFFPQWFFSPQNFNRKIIHVNHMQILDKSMQVIYTYTLLGTFMQLSNQTNT